jgi:molybdenum cofactor cytidylyltransferase
VRARRFTVSELAALDPAALSGAVLLNQLKMAGATLRKGTRLDSNLSRRLVAEAASGSLDQPVRAAWLDPDDMHEDDAAEQLAAAAAGEGVEARPLHQSRLDLAARWNGVLHVRIEQLRRLNSLDAIELFTLFHGQAVAAGDVVASVKVAPHIIPGWLIQRGLQIAHESFPVVDVRPYLALEVAALAVEAITGPALERFESGIRRKVEALGSIFVGTTILTEGNTEGAEEEARAALQALALDQDLQVILVGGVSAGDPLSPLYAALRSLGGRVLRHGVPAHPGSMIWLAELGRTRLLGLPQCGMFALATAADLILPRLLTGERLDAESLADLAHGGVLGKEMRFRFPAYARELDAPEPPR